LKIEKTNSRKGAKDAPRTKALPGLENAEDKEKN
jgi:hypothetical protein